MISQNNSNLPTEVEALLRALQLSEPNLQPIEHLSEAQWSSLLPFCEISHLTLPLSSLPLINAPLWVRERLVQNLSDNAKRYQAIKSSYRQASLALEQSGVEHIVIKGFTQSPDYVQRPELRFQSDLDLFCPPGQIDAARSALGRIGYQPSLINGTLTADHDHALVRSGSWSWKGNPFDPEMPLGIELHFCLWNTHVSKLNLPEIEQFWQNRIVRKIDDFSFPCLSQEDHLGYLCLHILRNIFLRDWIVHHVYELATFLHANAENNEFWSRWIKSHSETLRSLEAIAFYHATSWFGCRLHPCAQQEIERLALPQQAWLERFSDSALSNMFHQNKDGLWLHLSLVPSFKDKLHIFRRTMLPPQIAGWSSPKVNIRNKRVVEESTNPLVRYVGYLVSRSVSHSKASIATLFRGFSWWIAQHRLPSAYWLFLLASFFFNLGLSIFYFLFNLFLAGHGYDEKALGQLTSATAIGNLAGAFPAALLIRKIGLRPILLTCFVMAVFLSAARALFLSFSSQLILAAFAGITLSVWAVCLSPAVARLTQERQRPRAFSLLFSLGIGLGAIAGLLGSRLPSLVSHTLIHRVVEDSQQLVLLLSCVIVAIGIWPVSRLKFDQNTPVPERRTPLTTSPFLMRFLPAVAVWALVTGSFSPLATVYLAKSVQLSLHDIGNVFALSQSMQVVAVFLAPLLFRRAGLIPGILLTQLGTAASLVLLSSSTNASLAVTSYIFFSAFQWMNEPGIYSLLMNAVSPSDQSTASASNSFVVSASQAFAATLFGAAVTHYGYSLSIRCIACVALLSAILFANLRQRKAIQQESSAVLS
jgi:predicted MFS family arabinose efflux permease